MEETKIEQPGYIDPAYRFTVVYKDGTEMSQEDEKGVVVRDHCHVIDWNHVRIYALTNRPKDHAITVNFENGDFSINDTRIKMMLSDLDMFVGQNHTKAIFKPLYGRRHFQSDLGQSTLFFCGWETELDGKKIKRVIYVNEYGDVFMES